MPSSPILLPLYLSNQGHLPRPVPELSSSSGLNSSGSTPRSAALAAAASEPRGLPASLPPALPRAPASAPVDLDLWAVPACPPLRLPLAARGCSSSSSLPASPRRSSTCKAQPLVGKLVLGLAGLDALLAARDLCRLSSASAQHSSSKHARCDWCTSKLGQTLTTAGRHTFLYSFDLLVSQTTQTT